MDITPTGDPRPSATRANPAAGQHIDGSRPFGAHLRMAWWKPLVAIVVPPLLLLVLQVLGYRLAGTLTGSDDPMAATMTPPKFLAVNLATIVTGVLAVLLLARLARVPWRTLISAPRACDPRRLGRHLLGAAVLVAAGIGAVAVLAPDSPGWIAFGVSGTTVVIIVLTLLTTPLQALGEELMFRSVALPAAASWVRAVRPALALGIIVSSLLFALSHLAGDPWLFGYYTFIGTCTALMAIISGGIEASVAFHIANNVLFTIVNTVMSDGEPFAINRSSGSGDAAVLILALVNVAMLVLVLVWRRERKSRAA
jgi:membrane protease YdiL (CAAX protease family)